MQDPEERGLPDLEQTTPVKLDGKPLALQISTAKASTPGNEGKPTAIMDGQPSKQNPGQQSKQQSPDKAGNPDSPEKDADKQDNADKPDTPRAAKKPKTKMAQRLQDVNRWKTQYISLTQEAKTLASLIGSRPDWAWAAANKTDIESLEIDMRKIAEAPFVVELLAFDIAHIKRKFSEDRIFAETDPSLVIMF